MAKNNITFILLCWEFVGAQLRLNELCYMPGWYVVGIFCTAKIGVVLQQTSEKDTFFKVEHSQQWEQSELCVIFTILVSFSWDNTLFASKAKINVV